jgi:hypothetical protein
VGAVVEHLHLVRHHRKRLAGADVEDTSLGFFDRQFGGLFKGILYVGW